MRSLQRLLVIGVVLGGTIDAKASRPFYSDIVTRSPNSVYEVQARSPDNEKECIRGLQGGFVYTCVDKKSGKIVWTRKQQEGSPTKIFVSDAGWTVILIDGDGLIAVAISGRDTCYVSLLQDAMTQEEREKYVQETSAGPMWGGYSLWYFLDVGDQRLFVVRPWWGRRMVVDIEKGKLTKESQAIGTSTLAYERKYVMTELAKAVNMRQEWQKEEADASLFWPAIHAAYLAGRLRVREAIPLLRQLEEGDYIWNHEMLIVSRLSLRRLGEIPRPDWWLVAPRHTNADKIQKGMTDEQVWKLLGRPDFIPHSDDTWVYDMDADPPFSLSLKWNKRHNGKVIGIEKRTPPLWKEGFARDEAVVNGG